MYFLAGGVSDGLPFLCFDLDGLERNLRPSEMLDQIYQIQRDTGERVSNVVVMGSGEPLDNYDNLIRLYPSLTEEGGLHISQRNVTVPPVAGSEDPGAGRSRD